MSRLLVLFALLVAATSAISINLYQLTSSSTLSTACSGAPLYTFVVDVDTCSCYSVTADSCPMYQKVTLSGTTYTWGLHRTSACTTSALPDGSGAADSCLSPGAGSPQVFKLTTSDVSTAEFVQIDRHICTTSSCVLTVNQNAAAPGSQPSDAPSPTAAASDDADAPNSQPSDAPSPTAAASDDDDDNTGVIAGAVVGSLVGVAAVAGIASFFWKKNSNPSPSKVEPFDKQSGVQMNSGP